MEAMMRGGSEEQIDRLTQVFLSMKKLDIAAGVRALARAQQASSSNTRSRCSGCSAAA
jgi:hypothetical protein